MKEGERNRNFLWVMSHVADEQNSSRKCEAPILALVCQNITEDTRKPSIGGVMSSNGYYPVLNQSALSTAGGNHLIDL